MNIKTPGKAYNPEIDFWKLFFALTVFFMHSKIFEPASPILRRGYIAVEFFFIVSGFFLAAKTRSDERKGARTPTSEFLRHKLKGLYKVVLCAFIITFAAREFTEFESIQATARNFIPALYEAVFGRAYGLIITKGYNTPVWYIGSMLAAMTVLYPLAAKYRTGFFRVACPVIALSSYGVILNTEGILKVTEHLIGGFAVGGTLRALAGLCVGMFVNECCECLRRKNAPARVTKTGQAVFFIAEMMTAAGIVLYMQFADRFEWTQKYDFMMIPAFAIFCLIVFSELTGIKEKLRGTNLSALSKLSLYLYVSQRAAIYLMKTDSLSAFTFGKRLLIFCALTACSMLLCRALVFLLDASGRKCLPKIRKVLITMSNEQ